MINPAAIEPDKSSEVMAWHFLRSSRNLRYDRTNEYVEIGHTYSYTESEKPKLCERGMHASVNIFDACAYSPGPIACRVKVWGEIHFGKDKLCGRHRRVISMVDSSTLMTEFIFWLYQETSKIARDLMPNRKETFLRLENYMREAENLLKAHKQPRHYNDLISSVFSTLFGMIGEINEGVVPYYTVRAMFTMLDIPEKRGDNGRVRGGVYSHYSACLKGYYTDAHTMLFNWYHCYRNNIADYFTANQDFSARTQWLMLYQKAAARLEEQLLTAMGLDLFSRPLAEFHPIP